MLPRSNSFRALCCAGTHRWFLVLSLLSVLGTRTNLDATQPDFLCDLKCCPVFLPAVSLRTFTVRDWNQVTQLISRIIPPSELIVTMLSTSVTLIFQLVLPKSEETHQKELFTAPPLCFMINTGWFSVFLFLQGSERQPIAAIAAIALDQIHSLTAAHRCFTRLRMAPRQWRRAALGHSWKSHQMLKCYCLVVSF